MAINVTVSGSGQIVADVNGGSAADISVTGGIGPAAYISGTATTVIGVHPVAAGANITVTTTSGSYTIIGRDVPVQSVQGRIGAVVLTLADLTAAALVHTHSTTQVVGLTAAASAAAPVQTVQSRTGNVVITLADITAAGAVHTHSTTQIVGFTAAAAAVVHTHGTTDIVGLTAAASAAAPVQSVQSRTGNVVFTLADITAAAAVHTHSTTQVVGLTATIQQYGKVVSVQGKTGTVTLSVADLTAAAAAHTHSTTDIASFTTSVVAFSPVKSINGSTGTISIVGGANVTIVTDGTSVTVNSPLELPSQGGYSARVLGTDGTSPNWYAMTGGANMTISNNTTSKVIQFSATGGVSWQTAPASPYAAGSAGDIAYDASYLYVRSATAWKRVAFGSWASLGQPTSATATAGDSQASVSWTAPADNGGYSITDYIVQYSSNGGTSWATFSDGTSTATNATVTGLANGTAYIFRVAAINSAGTGPYSSATSSVTPVASGSGSDVSFSSVVALLHMDGSSFVDSSSLSASVSNSGATLTTSQSKFGGASGLFGSGYLTLPSNSAYNVGTGNFTIEMFLRPSALPLDNPYTYALFSLQGQAAFPGDSSKFWIGLDTIIDSYGNFTNGIVVGQHSTSNESAAAYTPSVNTWCHLAVVRDGSTIRIFIDGVAQSVTGSSNMSGISFNSNGLMIGSAFGYTPFAGYIDEFRFTKAARYSSNFSPPTAAFPNS